MNINYYSDEYFKNLKIGQWVKIRGTGNIYSPRTGHESIFYNNKIYIFGGTDDDYPKNDLFVYDIYLNLWEKM